MACKIAKTQVAARSHFPRSKIAFCDHIKAADGPPGYFVLALHSTRRCEGICSTNMGWFAVQRSTGRVFEWQTGEGELGPEVSPRP
jgi:hypothetical protein